MLARRLEGTKSWRFCRLPWQPGKNNRAYFYHLKVSSAVKSVGFVSYIHLEKSPEKTFGRRTKTVAVGRRSRPSSWHVACSLASIFLKPVSRKETRHSCSINAGRCLRAHSDSSFHFASLQHAKLVYEAPKHQRWVFFFRTLVQNPGDPAALQFQLAFVQKSGDLASW